MSIIVKGMKMPENCYECPFEMFHPECDQTVCMASLKIMTKKYKTLRYKERAKWCPLVEMEDGE